MPAQLSTPEPKYEGESVKKMTIYKVSMIMMTSDYKFMNMGLSIKKTSHLLSIKSLITL
jgi:hypothetical protein